MDRSYRMNISRRPDSTHIHLKGKFDGSLASLLVQALEAHCRNPGRIVVHTDTITNIHPFGIAVLQSHLPRLKSGPAKVTFTGENRDRIAP